MNEIKEVTEILEDIRGCDFCIGSGEYTALSKAISALQALSEAEKDLPEEKEIRLKEDTIGIDGYKKGFNSCRFIILPMYAKMKLKVKELEAKLKGGKL